MKNKSNYTEIESKALWYLQRYASSSENLRNYLRRKVKDSHLSINSEEIINEIIFSLERQANRVYMTDPTFMKYRIWFGMFLLLSGGFMIYSSIGYF